MEQKKYRNILFWVLCFVFSLGIIFIPSFKKDYKSNKYNNYSTTQIVEFEKSLFGATGWAAIDLPLKELPDSNSTTIVSVGTGQTFTILGENENYWEIVYTDSQNISRHGYVQHAYCMINLPDVIPSIKYNITNASGSIYRSKGYDIPNVTGEVLYGTSCENGICQKINGTGKVENNRIGRNEYIVPIMYSAAKKIGKAENLIREQNEMYNRNWSLMIYDSYRPVSVSQKVSQEFEGIITQGSENYNAIIYNGISSWCSPLTASDSQCRTYFIANVSPGHVSAHNQGAAVDVSLWDNSAGSEVSGSPTSVHELSEEAARCNIRATSSEVNNCTFSVGMSNSQMAQDLASIMTNSNVGMRPIASEWWHFQDDATLNTMNAITSTTGRDFQTTSIVSTYGYPKSFTNLVGDVNADGSVDVADAELIYNTYELLESCDTCDDIKSQADYNNDGSIDLDDVYAILNNDNDLLTSSYTIGSDYIYVGNGTFSNSNVVLKNVSNVSPEVSNNKYLIYYYNTVIKEYDIVSFSYTGHDLSKPYIYLENGLSELMGDITSHNFRCVNCVIDDSASVNTNKVFIKRNINDQQNLATYDLVYYVSDYSVADSIDIYETDVTNLINGFQCTNCTVGVYNNSSLVSSGEIPSNSYLIFKETVSGNNDVLKNASINIRVQEYTVSYRFGDGENDYLTGSYAQGEDIILGFDEPNLMYHQGKKLIGWTYNNQSYNLDDELLMPSYNIELVARWENISDGITNSNYQVDVIGTTNKVLTGVQLNTNVSDLNLGLSNEYTVAVYKSDNTTIKNTGKLGTGDIIKVKVDGNTVDKYHISITGDVSGDGIFNFDDAVLAYRGYFTDYRNMSDYAVLAVDYDRNNKSDFNDFVLMYRKYFQGN